MNRTIKQAIVATSFFIDKNKNSSSIHIIKNCLSGIYIQKKSSSINEYYEKKIMRRIMNNERGKHKRILYTYKRMKC